MKSRSHERPSRFVRLAQLVLVVLAARLAFGALAPPAVALAGRMLGFDLDWERMRFHLLRGAVEIHGLSVGLRTEDEDAVREPVLRASLVRADVAMLALLGANLRVQRAEAADVVLLLERRADGSVPLIDALLAPADEEDGDEEDDEAEPAALPDELASPIEIDALRAYRAKIVVRDEVAWPGREWTIEADVSADALGSRTKTARLLAHASAPGLFDALRAEAELETHGARAGLRAKFSAAGLRPDGYARWTGREAAPSVTALAAEGEVAVELALDSSAGQSDTALRGPALHGTVRAGGNVTADGEPLLRLERFEAVLAGLTPSACTIERVEVAGGLARFGRDEEGELVVLGVRVARESGDGVAAAASEPPAHPAEPAAPQSPSATAAAAAKPAAAFAFALGSLELTDLALRFDDRALEPTNELALRLARLSLTELDTRSDGAARLEVDVDAPGLVGRARAHGEAALFGAAKHAELEFEASELRCGPLQPYLAELGLQGTLREGSARGRFTAAAQSAPDGSLAGDLRFTDLTWRDGAEVLGVRSIELAGFAIDPSEPSFRARELVISGTTLPLGRDGEGCFRALGLRTAEKRSYRRALPEIARAVATAATAAAVSATTPEGPSTGPLPILPRIEIGRIAVIQNAVTWLDERLDPPLEVRFDDCGAELKDLALFGDPARHGPANGTLHVWSRAADLVRELSVEGALASQAGPLDLALETKFALSGIYAERAQPYLDPSGIQERLRDASLSGRARLALAQETSGLRAELQVDETVFLAGAGHTNRIGLLHVGPVHVTHEGALRVEQVHVENVELQVARDPVGALLTLGLRIPLGVFETTAGDTAVAPAAALAVAPAAASSPAEAALLRLPDALVEKVDVRGVTLGWTDHSREPPVSLSARFTANATGIATRAQPAPGRFRLEAAVDGSVETSWIEGTLAIAADRARTEFQVGARGVRAGTLLAYLPPGVTCDLADGRIEAQVACEVSAHAEGGLAAGIRVDRARIQDGEAGPALCAVDEVDLRVLRADPAARHFDVEAVRARGAELAVRRAADGTFHALGFGLGSAPAGGTEPNAASAPEHRDPRETQPVRAAGTAGAPATVLSNAAPKASETSAAPKRDVAPIVTPYARLGELDLELKRLSFTDELGGGTLELSARVSGPKGQVLVDADPQALAPIQLAVEGALTPFVREWRVDVEIQPWAAEPQIAARFEALGISAAELAQVDPALATWVDGSGLTEGVARGAVAVRPRWQRRSPYDLDLRTGFAGEIAAGPFEFRAEPEGEVLLGLESVEAEIARVDPARGRVHLRTLEFSVPRLRARRTSDGLEVLGLVLHPERRPAAPEPAQAGDAPPASAKETVKETAKVAASEPDRPVPELRIDELAVEGIDVVVRDDAATPPTVIALGDLDVRVQRFTTRALRQPVPIRFEVLMGPSVDDATGLVAASAPADGTANGGGYPPIFEEWAFAGHVQLVPEISASLQSGLTTLDLTVLKGTAALEGVEIESGTLDTSTRLRVHGDELRLDSQLSFTDLAVSEGEAGPVRGALGLPMPLDAAIFVLEDPDGAVKLSIGFTLKGGDISAASLVRAAIEAISVALTTALASAPARAIGGVTGLFGISNDSEPESRTLSFAPGSTRLSARDEAELLELVPRLRSDEGLYVAAQHRLCPADVERAGELVQPTPADVAQLAAGLRRRRLELARQRDLIVTSAHAEFGLGSREGLEASRARLCELEIEANAVEEALDKLFDSGRPRSERQVTRRKRLASLALARERLETVHAWFAAQRIPDMEVRWVARKPRFDVAADGESGSLELLLRRRR